MPGLPNGLDLEHVAEEIEDVGRSELRIVESFAEIILRHLVKIASVPDARSARHWREEIQAQHEQLRANYARSMHQLIDIDRVWRAAEGRADAALDEHGDAILSGLSRTSPFSLDDLLAEPFDVDAALARLRAAAAT